jgi:hypothetical protein
MKKGLITLAMLLAAANSWAANDDDDRRARRLSASLHSHNEVPAVSSPASGRFKAAIDDANEMIRFELSFDGLQAAVVQAHIHFAQPNVNGGIMVWLCGTTATPGPAGTATCPQGGTVEGTIDAADIGLITAQGIAPGEFKEVAAAIRAGLAYVNVHTSQSPGGEIRGQIRVRD